MQFAPLQTQRTVEVQINDDQLVEGSETFVGMLSLPVGSRGLVLGLSTATAEIIDDDGMFLKQLVHYCHYTT